MAAFAPAGYFMTSLLSSEFHPYPRSCGPYWWSVLSTPQKRTSRGAFGWHAIPWSMLQSHYGMSQGKDRRNGSFQLSLGTSIWIKKTKQWVSTIPVTHQMVVHWRDYEECSTSSSALQSREYLQSWREACSRLLHRFHPRGRM